MNNIKQLSQKESIKLRHRVYKLELELKEKHEMLINKEISINAVIERNIQLSNHIQYLKNKIETLQPTEDLTIC